MEYKKANILWLIKGFGLGGAEMLLSIALPHLDRDDFNYRAGYFLPWKNALVPDLEAAGLDVTCFNAPRHWDPLTVTRLADYVRRNNIDLIHAHLPFTGVAARLAGRLTGAKVVYTEHNMWDRLNPVMRKVNQWTYGLNDFSITVSKDVEHSLRGVDMRRVTTIDNGVDCTRLQAIPDVTTEVRAELGIPFDHFVVGKVANLTPKKNHENLLQAFALFYRELPASTLLLVGQPADRLGELQTLAKDLGIAERVVFTGGRSDVPRLVKAFDLFAMSSDFEGLPIAMLEAMALGKPIVATAVGGIPGVVRDGIEGYTVPARQPALLAEKMLLLARDKNLRRTLGLQSATRVRNEYDIAVMVRKVENIYREVLSR